MSETRKRRWGQFTVRFLLVLMTICAVGSAVFLRPGPNNVSGLVTINGMPGNGEIVFVDAAGAETKCKLQPDGRFDLRLKTGEYTVAIESPTVAANFSDSRMSGLAVFVADGENNLALDLKN